jgi:hypothetical protein
MAKTGDLVAAHVAADHSVGQARLEWLIEDAAIGRGEIGGATLQEVAERHVLRHAAA